MASFGFGLGRKGPARLLQLTRSSPAFSNRPMCRTYAITGNPAADKVLNTVSGGRAEGWLSAYERSVGLTDVREAQGKVIQVGQTDQVRSLYVY